ncbi:CvpA family protein [Fusobacterium sp.]|uniref:CvpA family protein n=1 Tax=Fusobacterium sp. TaxID=68766 RepID=UPI00396C83B2
MYLDIVVLIVLVLSILDGLKNGLFVEFLSVFGLVINFLLAKYLTPKVIVFLNQQSGSNNYFVVYIIIFWAVYIVVGLLLHWCRSIMDSQSKGLLVKFLGAVLGSVKGFILAMIIIFCFDFAVDNFKGLEKYRTGSRSTEIFLKVAPVVEEHMPKIFKDKLNSIKNEKILDRFLSK